MSDGQLDRILDAAYVCFTRHGVRRTTMDDLARTAGMSRPTVYQYVRNKEDAYRRLAERLYAHALDEARAALARPGPVEQRLGDALVAKLSLTLRLHQDSPHAGELVGDSARLASDESQEFTTSMVALLADATRAELPGVEAAELAELLMSLTRGLEADLTDPDEPVRRLRLGTSLLVTGARSRLSP